MKIDDPVSAFHFTVAVNEPVRFGIAMLIEGKQAFHWENSEEKRDALFEKILADARARHDRTLLELQKVLARSNGEVYASFHEAPTRVQWRETILRTSDPVDWVHREQRAVIDLYSGRILVTDRNRRFSKDQYTKWSRENCLAELRTSGESKGKPFWPAVIPSEDDDAHYQVAQEKDLLILRTECNVLEAELQKL